MKKTVIIAIFLVYLASIVAVNFFGLKMVMFETNQYVTSIVVNGIIVEREEQTEVTTLKDAITQKPRGYMFAFIPNKDGYSYEESQEDNPNVITIDYVVNPFDAANKKLRYDYDREDATGKVIVDEETGKITFLKPYAMMITLRATDSSQVQTSVSIYCQYID